MLKKKKNSSIKKNDSIYPSDEGKKVLAFIYSVIVIATIVLYLYLEGLT